MLLDENLAQDANSVIFMTEVMIIVSTPQKQQNQSKPAWTFVKLLPQIRRCNAGGKMKLYNEMAKHPMRLSTGPNFGTTTAISVVKRKALVRTTKLKAGLLL